MSTIAKPPRAYHQAEQTEQADGAAVSMDSKDVFKSNIVPFHDHLSEALAA
jgi:hypothetical protein